MATPAQRVAERLALAEQAAAAGNLQAAANYAQAAANIKGSGQATVQEVANQYIAAANPPRDFLPIGDIYGPYADGGDGGGTPAPTPTPTPTPTPEAGPSAQDEYWRLRGEREAAEAAERARQQRESAASFLRGILEQYNMGSLATQVESLIGQWGTNVEVIAERLRQTDEYKTRFKGLVGLQTKGITDIRNEAEYLRLESEYRSIFREAGLRDFLGASGTQAEYDSIANLVADYSLSVNEVRARVADAQRVAAETPQEVRDALQRFYNVGAQDLVAYSLDPQRTMTRINEMANAAILGGFAARGGLDIDVAGAERVAGLAGAEDINIERVTRDIASAREIRDATRRLAEIERGTLQDIEVLEAEAGTDVEAGERIRGLQSRERARFGGSTAVGATTLMRGDRI